MAALQDLLDEQARIKQELQRMEDDDSVTEEDDGDLRDTLVARWKELDTKSKPLIERMEQIHGITRAAADPANVEGPAGQNNGSGGYVSGDGGEHRWRSPDMVTSRFRNPYDDLEAVRGNLVPTAELHGRALDAVELEARRGSLVHEYAETATRVVQSNPGTMGRGIAKHILQTGSPEYQEAFRAYLEDPQGNIQRAALSLTLANGGFHLVAAA